MHMLAKSCFVCVFVTVQVVEVVDAFVLTDNVSLHLAAKETGVDALGNER